MNIFVIVILTGFITSFSSFNYILLSLHHLVCILSLSIRVNNDVTNDYYVNDNDDFQIY